MVEVSLVPRFHKEDIKLRKVLSLLGHSWAPQILHRLDYYGKLRYNELKDSLKNVSSTSLSRVLNDLTANNVTQREIVDSSPPQVYYSLTRKGKVLARLVLEALKAEDEISGSEQEQIEAFLR